MQPESDYQARAAVLVDGILDLLEESAAAGVELDPLQVIVERLQARGESLDMSEAPPVMRMLLGGMLG